MQPDHVFQPSFSAPIGAAVPFYRLDEAMRATDAAGKIACGRSGRFSFRRLRAVQSLWVAHTYLGNVCGNKASSMPQNISYRRAIALQADEVLGGHTGLIGNVLNVREI
jgi:hypothetical protein